MDHEALYTRLQVVKNKLSEKADAERHAWHTTMAALGEVENLQRQVLKGLETKDAVGSAK